MSVWLYTASGVTVHTLHSDQSVTLHSGRNDFTRPGWLFTATAVTLQSALCKATHQVSDFTKRRRRGRRGRGGRGRARVWRTRSAASHSAPVEGLARIRILGYFGVNQAQNSPMSWAILGRTRGSRQGASRSAPVASRQFSQVESLHARCKANNPGHVESRQFSQVESRPFSHLESRSCRSRRPPTIFRSCRADNSGHSESC